MNEETFEAWQYYPARDRFDAYAEAWGALNRRLLHAHPLGDRFFVSPLVKHFANDRTLLAVQPSGGTYRGMLLLRVGRWGVVSSFRPAQTEICPVLVRSLEDLQSLFAILPRSTLVLQLHCQDPDYCVTPPPASSGLITKVEQHATTVTIDLRHNFDDYWGNRPVKLQKNIGRSLRTLHQNGVIWAFKTVESALEIQSAVDRYGDLESRGWKFESGTSVHSTNTQGRFYREILGNFAESGKGVVYELYFDGELVSSQLAVGNETILITLKTTYDEEFSKYSPGKLLDYLTLRHEFQMGRFRKVEFCTKAGPDLTRWGTRTRPVSHITVYRNKFAWRLVHVYTRLKSIAGRMRAIQDKHCSSHEAHNGEGR